MLTIFTPTYNRANTLPKLYESLKNQTSKNFEWLIVDDGSTDNTEKLVKEFLTEQTFETRYIKQENQGKHIAINTGLKLALGEYIVVIDSDDYLSSHCVEICENLINETESKNCDGFTFIRFSESVLYDEFKYGRKRWSKHYDYHWEFQGEMMYCIKKEVFNRFTFPQFEGEKFCPESLILRRIENKHEIMYTDYVLAYGDYLDEGLTKNYYKLLFQNPHSSLLNYKEKINGIQDEHLKLQIAKNYYDIAWKSDKTTLKEKFFTLAPDLTIKILWNKITGKK